MFTMYVNVSVKVEGVEVSSKLCAKTVITAKMCV